MLVSRKLPSQPRSRDPILISSAPIDVPRPHARYLSGLRPSRSYRSSSLWPSPAFIILFISRARRRPSRNFISATSTFAGIEIGEQFRRKLFGCHSAACGGNAADPFREVDMCLQTGVKYRFPSSAKARSSRRDRMAIITKGIWPKILCCRSSFVHRHRHFFPRRLASGRDLF